MADIRSKPQHFMLQPLVGMVFFQANLVLEAILPRSLPSERTLFRNNEAEKWLTCDNTENAMQKAYIDQ